MFFAGIFRLSREVPAVPAGFPKPKTWQLGQSELETATRLWQRYVKSVASSMRRGIVCGIPSALGCALRRRVASWNGNLTWRS